MADLDAKYPFQVVAEFETREDAVAFLELTHGVAPKATLKGAPGARKEQAHRDRRLGKIILAYMPVGRSVSAEDVGAHIHQFGYSNNSASSTLSAMVKEGDVVRLSPNIYQKVVKPDATPAV